jgi:hypothetical protein
LRKPLLLGLAVLLFLGCISAAACKGPENPESDAPSTHGQSPTPQATIPQTDDAADQGSIWDAAPLIPLSFRKTEVEREPPSIQAHPAGWTTTEWRHFLTPEALPTMRRYFTNEMPNSGWGQPEWIDEVETSLSYWTSDSGADGATVWMVPEGRDALVAVGRSR